ncbi:ferredoxin reductase [Aeromicrobium sp.]|uniref:ferredoxin reductase n=1 Tax=Aeromicrobium sp. TaxID=1871063 RepID=UPI0019ACF20E|nr:ferredoxin reductase [Aeromicrobium sp.]MBC7632888.1 ferredoxin reductase [Aeromicrobium sp.]
MGIVRSALASKPVAALTSPHHVDHYLERIHPMATASAVRGTVVEVRRETGDASTVVIRANGAWKGFRPGQHVQFGVEVDGTRRVRVFSVSSSAATRTGRARRTFSVSVKAHPDGYVSQFLHRQMTPGTTIFLSQAEGEFVLPAHVPDHVLLVSGGSGITPVMSMVRTLRDQAKVSGGHSGRITFLHYARTFDDEMFTTELDRLADASGIEIVRVYTRESVPGAELTGRFTIDHLKHLGIDPVDTLTYACGPAGLIATVRDTYADLGASDQLRMEYFKVPSVDLTNTDAAGTLEFDLAGTTTENSGATILEQAEAAGLTPAFGCRMGVCNTCAVKKLGGAVRHVVSGEVKANTDETIKICVHVPVGDVTVAL